MYVKVFSQLCITFLLFALDQILVSAVEEKEVLEAKFNVEPGGEVKTYTGEGDGLKCEFTYACQGGTLEEWEMIIYREADGHYTCTVERMVEEHIQRHSYIFFESFKLRIYGGKITKTTLYDKDLGELADPEEKGFISKHKHWVTNGDKFEHSLGKIVVEISRKKHHEL